jgi:hypothetical protein
MIAGGLTRACSPTPLRSHKIYSEFVMQCHEPNAGMKPRSFAASA